MHLFSFLDTDRVLLVGAGLVEEGVVESNIVAKCSILAAEVCIAFEDAMTSEMVKIERI
jgi:hypothetical protein